MAGATADVLDLLAEAGAVSVPPVEVTADVRHCAEALVALLNEWADDAADRLFTDNVALDEPYADRVAAAKKLADDHGPITIARVVADTAASATVVAHAGSVEIHIEFQTSPFSPARIQLYEIKLTD
jgi:hypothetical protein